MELVKSMVIEMDKFKDDWKIEKVVTVPKEWTQVVLGDEVKKIVGGGTPSRERHDFYHGSIPWVTVKDMNGSLYKSTAQEFITEEAIRQSSANLIEENNVIVATRIALGRAFINEAPIAINQDLKAIYLKDSIYPLFFLYWYLSQNSLIQSMGSGSTVKGIRLEQLKKLNILLPSMREQKKITKILSAVDEQIEKTEKLIEKTKELKKGLGQQLLTKGIGHSEFRKTEIGEIPVDWKIKSFVELMEPGSEGVKRGPFGGALKKNIFVEDGYAVYEQQHAIYKNFNKIRYFIDDIKYAELKAFEIKPNDIIVSCSGTIGKIAIVPDSIKQGVMNQALLRFRALKNTVDTLFLFYLLTFEETQKKMLDMTHGSTIKNMIAVSEIKKIKVPLPSYEEQQRISDILSSVDDQIKIYEIEKEKQVELKKALMQQLLTGKIRVTV